MKKDEEKKIEEKIRTDVYKEIKELLYPRVYIKYEVGSHYLMNDKYKNILREELISHKFDIRMSVMNYICEAINEKTERDFGEAGASTAAR
jgi:hypothetical protein